MHWYRLLILLVLGTLTACQAETTTTEPVATPSQESNKRVTATAPAAGQATPIAVDGTEEGEPAGGNADVISVRAVQAEDATWTFSVTVAHPDTGWDDYADGWDVLTPDGTVLKRDPDDRFTRLLLHPHVDEQPFTRSQSGIVIPDGVTEVTVRAHDMVAGYGGEEVVVDLTVSSGPGFAVDGQTVGENE